MKYLPYDASQPYETSELNVWFLCIISSLFATTVGRNAGTNIKNEMFDL